MIRRCGKFDPVFTCVCCGAIGLLDGQKSQDMICKTYQSIHDWREQEKRVTWERSCQDATSVCPSCQKKEDPEKEAAPVGDAQ